MNWREDYMRATLGEGNQQFYEMRFWHPGFAVSKLRHMQSLLCSRRSSLEGMRASTLCDLQRVTKSCAGRAPAAGFHAYCCLCSDFSAVLTK